MTVQPIRLESKTPDEKVLVEFEFETLLANTWAPGKEYSASDVVRPTVPNGFEYVAGDDGQSSHEEPAWPVAAAGTVADGSITWTAQEVTAAGVDSIAGSSQTVTSDSDLTIASVAADGTTVSALISGGLANREYLIVAQVTTDAAKIRELTAILPVRY